jgi:hypothetical protein
MPSFDLPVVGAVDFPQGTNGHWQFALPFRGGEVPVDIHTVGDTFTRGMLEEVKGFIADAARFDEIARDAFRAEFNEKPDDGSVGIYLSHHAEELGEKDLLKIFAITCSMRCSSSASVSTPGPKTIPRCSTTRSTSRRPTTSWPSNSTVMARCAGSRWIAEMGVDWASWETQRP